MHDEASHGSAPAGVRRIWELLDERVSRGLLPGYVAALRLGGQPYLRAAGRMSVAGNSAPMHSDAPVRIASVTKRWWSGHDEPAGGMARLTLQDPIARWLPEAARPARPGVPGRPARSDHGRGPAGHRPAPADPYEPAAGVRCWKQPRCRRRWWTGCLPRSADARGSFRGTSSWRGSPVCRSPSSRGRDGCTTRASTCSACCWPGPPGKPLSQLVAERITGPLGMTATSFGTPDTGRLATAYQPGTRRARGAGPADGVVSQARRSSRS